MFIVVDDIFSLFINLFWVSISIFACIQTDFIKKIILSMRIKLK